MKMNKCDLCNGTGKISVLRRDHLQISVQVKCDKCNGTGHVKDERCKGCRTYHSCPIDYKNCIAFI